MTLCSAVRLNNRSLILLGQRRQQQNSLRRCSSFCLPTSSSLQQGNDRNIPNIQERINNNEANFFLFRQHIEKRSFSASAEPSRSEDTSSTREKTQNQREKFHRIHTGLSDEKPLIGKEDEKLEERKRMRLSDVQIADVLKAKHSLRWVDPIISKNESVKEAIRRCIDGGLSAMMVVDTDSTENSNNSSSSSSNDKNGGNNNRKVLGLLTSRDLLRIMSLGIKEGTNPNDIFNFTVSEFMTPVSQIIYARPEETIGMCRSIMAKLGIKCLPILSKSGKVEGLITARDMSDYGLEAKDKGGKTAFLKDVSERVGLSSNTSMADPPAYLEAHLALEQKPLYINVGVGQLPHPFKTAHGHVGANQRDFGQGNDDYSTDPNNSEDAYFLTSVVLPDEKNSSLTSEVTYMGIADGVGSWREYGVDPREFSRSLMKECESILHEAATKGPQILGVDKYRTMINPTDILNLAYQKTVSKNIIGSSTACIAVFDNVRHQLHFSNLGDSGIIVLRHIDSDVAGVLKRDRQTPRIERKSDLRVAFVSQQQLISFNHPFQLGWNGEKLDDDENGTSSFKNPLDSCTSSVHVRRGDIIIMATDGLFDNVEVDDIASISLEWEQKYGFIRSGDVVAREKRWSMGNSLSLVSSESIDKLADMLCWKARENSLNRDIDSPFAILAKENDIMWSGGMPDDCTVLALHVVGRRPDDILDRTDH